MKILQVIWGLISDKISVVVIECSLISIFIADETGAIAIEYGLVAALIAMACVAAIQAVGSNLSDSFEATADALDQ